MTRQDLFDLATILDDTALFPSHLLPEMAEPYLSGAAPQIWLTVLDGLRVLGFAYCEPERMTEGAYNLLAIAVDPARQGRGAGRRLVADVEHAAKQGGGRILLVETSSLPEWARTRRFYERLGFVKEATIRDFYRKGEAKVVYWKEL